MDERDGQDKFCKFNLEKAFEPQSNRAKTNLIRSDLPLMVRQAHGSTSSPRTEDQPVMKLIPVRPELVEGL